MMGRFAASGAPASNRRAACIAAVKRCVTQNRAPKHGAIQSREWAAGRLRSTLLASCILASPFAAPCRAQSSVSGTPTPAQTSAPEVKDSRPRADTIFIHANVYTGVPSNAQFSSILREEAIAVRGDRIQAVGKNAEIEKLKGPQTQVIDLGGHFVMPGFNDAHLHLADAGLQKLNVDLTGVKTLDEFRERVLAKVEKAKPGEWILGGGWG